MSDLLEQLFALRDEQRKKWKVALVKGNELAWEKNRHGIMRWFMHPNIENSASQSLVVYEQSIPPQSRSGRQKHPGNVVIFVLEGKGFTLIDGVKHTWEGGDVVQLPIREQGVIFQHINTDANQAARLLHVQANHNPVLGVDRQSGFEQLENAPEYYDK